MKKRMLAVILCMAMIINSTGILTFASEGEQNGIEIIEEVPTPEAEQAVEDQFIYDDISGVTYRITQEADTVDAGKVSVSSYKESRDETDEMYGKYMIPETISSEGRNYTVVSIDADAFAEIDITEIAVPDGVELIDENAFGERTNLIIYCNASSVAEQYAIQHEYRYITDGVKLEADSMSIEVGQTEELKIQMPEWMRTIAEVQWISDNEEVMSVDSQGIITGNQIGSASVSVKVGVLTCDIKITITEQMKETAMADNSTLMEEVHKNQREIFASERIASTGTQEPVIYVYNNQKYGFADNHIYYLSDTVTSWEDAKKTCEERGGHLATISTVEEQKNIESMLQFGKKPAYWIGGKKQSGSWSWLNGDAFEFTNWNSGEPNYSGDYIQLYNYEGCIGKWDDTGNSGDSGGGIRQEGYICEWDSMDSLDIVLTELWDGDSGINYNGHTYTLISESMNWADAEAYCESNGGYLATITSPEEQEIISSLGNIGVCWVGGVLNESTRECRWITGEPFEYENWNEGEPNNSGNSNENRIVIYNTGKWDDVNENRIFNEFVMERDEITQKSYSEDLNNWILNKGTYNSISYLIKDENFPCSLAVAKSDSDFAEQVVQSLSNLMYRGMDGWFEIFAKTSSKEQAEKVLVGLLVESDAEIKVLTEAETAKKFADIVVDSIKHDDWYSAVEYGLNSEEIKSLSKVCTQDLVANYLKDGKYDSLAECLRKQGGYSDTSNVMNYVKSFEKSEYLAKEISKGVSFLGNGLTILSAADKTMKRMYEIEHLIKADEMYSEMLYYISTNCAYKPVVDAANELYEIIHDGYKAQISYVTRDIANAIKDVVTDATVDEVLDKAVSKFPYAVIIKDSAKLGINISNEVFKIDETQQQKDNMRCVAYIANCLSSWITSNLDKYMHAFGIDKSFWAKRTIYSYKMLLDTRRAGEQSLQKMMELSSTNWKKVYTLSLEVTKTLKSNADLLNMQGVLNNITTSVVACPVNVEIYDASGNLVLTVLDGSESEGYLNDIFYSVVYQPLDNDYVKIIRFPDTSGYSLRCIATDLGSVDYSVSTISDEGKAVYKEAVGIPVAAENEIVVSDISGEAPTCVLNQNGQTTEYTAQSASEEFIAVESIQIDKESLQLKEDEKIRINATIAPTNASIQEVNWSSSDSAVADVNSDGVITAVKEGTAVIKATASNNSEAFVELPVTIIMKDGIFPVSGDKLAKEYTGSAIQFSSINRQDIKWRGDGEAVIEEYYLDANGVTKTSETDNSGAGSEGGAPVNAGSYYMKVNVNAGTTEAAFSAMVPFDITKLTPNQELLSYAAPAMLVVDGNPKYATVEALESVIGMGEITIKYMKLGSEGYLSEAPTEAGQYEVYVDITEGQNYTAINDMLVSQFVVANRQFNVQLTSRVDGSTDDTTVALLQGGGNHDENSEVTVTAPKKEGYEFLGWHLADTSEAGYSQDAVSMNLAYTFTLTSDIGLVAVYKANVDVSLTITGSYFTVNDGTEQTNGSFTRDYKAGTKIKLTATGKNFAYWMNSSKKIVSASEVYEFTIVGATTYTPVYKNASANVAYVEFVSAYGQIMQAASYGASEEVVLPTGPSKIGHKFIGWDKNSKALQDAITSGATYIRVNPLYEAVTDVYTITVAYRGAEAEQEVYSDIAAGSTMTLQAKTIAGKRFSHWASDEEGKNALGTSENYFIAVTKNLTIYAIYVNDTENVERKPTIAVTDQYAVTVDGKNKITFIVTRDVPEGYTVIDTGALYGISSAFGEDGAEEKMVLGAGSLVQMQSTMTGSGVYALTVNVGSSIDTTVYARGYMTVRNETTGNIEMIYSTINSGSYNSLK